MNKQKLLEILQAILLANDGLTLKQIIQTGIPEELAKEGMEVWATLENE